MDRNIWKEISSVLQENSGLQMTKKLAISIGLVIVIVSGIMLLNKVLTLSQ